MEKSNYTKTRLKYGKEELQISLPSKVKHLITREVKHNISPEIFKAQLRNSLAFRQLQLEKISIVVADKTRLCGYPQYLPILLETLIEQGAKKENITFFIAYGTHPDQSEEECLAAYGETYKQYSFIHHHSDDPSFFETIRVTQRGTPVRIRKDLLNSSCVITMGAICHHYFAGYGGGRKLLFPGCGEKKSIYANHSLFLDEVTRSLTTNCQPGILENNPLAEDLFDFEQSFKAHLAIHGIMDQYGQLSDIIVGNTKEDFLNACTKHAESFELQTNDFDMVIASCGGYPKDINLIQAHKAIHNSSMFVKDGGHLLVYCECIDGVSSDTLLPWFEFNSFDDAFTALKQNYQGNGGTALSIMTKTDRIAISLVTGLEKNICETLGITSISPQQAQNLIKEHQGSIAFIPNASLTIRTNTTNRT